MCGVTCLISKEVNFRDLYLFNKSLEDNESRGGDSVGILAYNLKKKEYVLNYHFKREVGDLMIPILENIDLNDPYVVLGHTRATATGSRIDYHPALSSNGRWAIIHNGVVDIPKIPINYPLNDTYQWAEYIQDNGLFNPNNIKASGTSAFILDLLKGELYGVNVGYNPLLECRLNDKTKIFSSLKINGLNCTQIKKGSFKINFNNLKRNKIKKLIGKFPTTHKNYNWVNCWDNYHYNIEKGKKVEKGGIKKVKRDYCIYEEFKTELCSMCQGCCYDETLTDQQQQIVNKRWGVVE